MAGRHYEEFRVGDVFETGEATLSEGEIIEFARRYDPQSFHVDAEAAAKGPFGGLIASGFQTLALTFRLLVDTGIIDDTSQGGSGGDELRWTRPVRPGDTLRVRAEVIETRPSSRGGRGTVRLAYTTFNQRGEVVMTITLNHLVACRMTDAG